MILSEKIIMLRKKFGWSQEELAQQLDVSRQSVSKWELGAAIPDLDKILRLSQLFGVSTDYLLKDDAEDIAFSDGESDEQGVKHVSVEEANTYMNLVKTMSTRFAYAISALILSPALLILLSAFSEDKGTISESVADGLGFSALIIIVACGVSVLIYNGMKLSKYDYLDREAISLEYGVKGIVDKKKAEFEDTFRLYITVGVAICIIGAVPLFLVGAVTDDDFLSTICVPILLLFVSVGVNLFVKAGMIDSSYNKLLQSGDYSVEKKEVSKTTGVIGGIYWPIIVAIFLGYSFITDNWGMSWIIWPVAGVLFGAICGVVSLVKK